MNKILNIVPSAKIVSQKKSQYILLTANNSVTDDVWEVLRCTDSIYDLGSFEIARENQTQFSFCPNPGFNIEQVKSLVVAGTYIAATYKNFESFSSIPLAAHIANIQGMSFVTFEGALYLDIIEYVLTAWAQKKALIYSYNLYVEKISRCGRNNEKFTQDRVKAARDAHNRLFYAKPENHGITPQEKRGNLSTIETMIRVLESDHNQMRDLSVRTKKARESGARTYETYKGLLDTLSFDQYCDAWKKFVSTMGHLNEELLSIEAENNFENGGIVLRQILELAPAGK